MQQQPNLQPEEQGDEDLARANRLQASAEDEVLLKRMRLVDQMMLNAPEEAPRPGFAMRVLEAIRQSQAMRTHGGLGVLIGLGMALALVTTIVSVAGILLIVALANWTVVYQILLQFMGDSSGLVVGLLDWLNGIIDDTPLIPLLSLLSIPLFLVWLSVMRRLLVTKDVR